MRKTVFLLLTLAAVFSSLVPCKNKKSSEEDQGLPDYVPYDKIPESYSKEMAEEDGCIIIESRAFLQFEYDKQFSEGCHLVSGKDLWEKFLALEEQGEYAKVRIYYYAGGVNQEGELPEHRIHDLSCEDGKYNLTFEEAGEIVTEEYDVLKYFEGDYHKQEWFIMGEKFQKKEYSSLLRDIFSSKATPLGDYIPGKTTWKLIYISDEEESAE